jgi:hypothetical protein
MVSMGRQDRQNRKKENDQTVEIRKHDVSALSHDEFAEPCSWIPIKQMIGKMPPTKNEAVERTLQPGKVVSNTYPSLILKSKG